MADCNKLMDVKGKREVAKYGINGCKLTVLSEFGFKSRADQGILSPDFSFSCFSS